MPVTGIQDEVDGVDIVDRLGGGPQLAILDEEPLGAGFDPGVAAFPRNLQEPLGRGRHQRGPVQIDRGGHFSRITPKVKPATMYFRAITIRTRGTDMAITP